MNTRRESKRRGGRRSVGMQLIGLGGLVCIAWAITGLVLSLSNRNSTSVSSGVVELAPAVQAAGAENFSRSVSESSHEVLSPSYYPLQVGRYWVYKHVDGKSESVMEIERRIVRRERRDGSDGERNVVRGLERGVGPGSVIWSVAGEERGELRRVHRRMGHPTSTFPTSRLLRVFSHAQLSRNRLLARNDG